MNALLIYIAFKHTHTNVNWANVSIVVFVTGVFLASILPHFAYFLKNRQDWTDSVALRWTVATTLVSTFSNPFIYFLTNPNFRTYTTRLVIRNIPAWGSRCNQEVVKTAECKCQQEGAGIKQQSEA